MNILKRNSPLPLRARMVFRLWLSMMALILLSVGFLWFGQIFLFEQNYLNSAMSEVETRLEPVMEQIKTVDLAENTEILSYLSTTANGKMMLTDESGKLLAMYTYGHPMDLGEAEQASATWKTIRESDEYQSLLLGEQYKKVTNAGGKPVSFEIGIPILYEGERAYVVFYRMMNEAGTVLDVNRQQLMLLSILLTLVAAIFAAFLARRFTRPIQEVKQAVDRLAAGDLAAVPQLKLEDEIGQLAHSVEKLGQALQRVDILRKEVIANISHELRSPLALISGYAEMVRDINWRDDQKREDDLNLIIHEARRMSEMVSDILDYSQFQSGYIKLKKDSYNLCDIVEAEVTHCAPTAAENGLAIELAGASQEIPIFADALKLSQVIRNLLYNAINHTEGGTTITVTVTREKELCRVSVANPGTPIPKEEQELIWERYQRSQHQGGRSQGTGLGLSIVSTILKAQGMSYGVGCLNGLTVFWFSAPINERQEVS